jgi:hypothetical protein
MMDDLHIYRSQPDVRSFVRENGNYIASEFYMFIFKVILVDVTINYIWKLGALPKLKVFVLLLFMDRLNTKDLMIRKTVACIRGVELHLML